MQSAMARACPLPAMKPVPASRPTGASLSPLPTSDLSPMTLDSLIYLLEIYWPFVVGAGVVGLGTGWFSVTARKG